MKIYAKSLSGNRCVLEIENIENNQNIQEEIRTQLATFANVCERQIAIFCMKSLEPFSMSNSYSLQDGDEIGYWIYQSVPEGYQKHWSGPGHSFIYYDSDEDTQRIHIEKLENDENKENKENKIYKNLYTDKNYTNLTDLLTDEIHDVHVVHRIAHLWNVYC